MVSEVRIYAEGGGDGKEGKAAMREGFGRFMADLRERARRNRIRWQVVACGARNAALDAFCTALRTHPDAFNVLLVDSEGALSSSQPWQHLQARDGWTPPACPDEHCQLMVQEMEAWIVADPDAIEAFYGHGFRRDVLPAASDIETVDRTTLANALRRATEGTTPGRYHKLRHAPRILGKLDPGRVRARARHCDRLFRTLEGKLT